YFSQRRCDPRLTLFPYTTLFRSIYYERYVVINPGVKEADGIQKMDFLTEEEYLDIIDSLPKGNQQLDDDDPNKFIARMGAEALQDRKSTRLNSSHVKISYAVFCL